MSEHNNCECNEYKPQKPIIDGIIEKDIDMKATPPLNSPYQIYFSKESGKLWIKLCGYCLQDNAGIKDLFDIIGFNWRKNNSDKHAITHSCCEACMDKICAETEEDEALKFQVPFKNKTKAVLDS